MKKSSLVGLIVLFALASCNKNEVSIDDTVPAIPDVLYSPSDYNLDMRDFALAVNEAVNTNKSFRKLVKVEVDKMFDGDFNVLLSQIVDTKVDNYEQRADGTIMRAPGNISVRDLLNSSFQKVQERTATKGDVSLSQRHKAPGRDLVVALTEQYPKLQIAVPFLEEQLEDENYIPPVVFLPEEYSEQTTEYLPGIKIDKEYAQTAKVIPDYACIVISMNERMEFDRYNPNRAPNNAPPPTPTSLTAKLTDFGIELDWTMPNTVTEENTYGYKIYRSVNSGNYSLLYTNNSYMNRSYRDNQLEFNTTYRYYVVSYNDVGSSPAVYNGSGIVVSTRPATAQKFEVNPIGLNKVKFNWRFADSDNNGTLKIYKRSYWTEDAYPQNPFYTATLPVQGTVSDGCIITGVSAGSQFEYRAERTTPTGTSAPIYDMLYMPHRDVSKATGVYVRGVKFDKVSKIESWRGAPEYKIKWWRVKNDGTNLPTEVCTMRIDCSSKKDDVWYYTSREVTSGWQPGFDGATWYDRMGFYVIELDDNGTMENIAGSLTSFAKWYKDSSGVFGPTQNSNTGNSSGNSQQRIGPAAAIAVASVVLHGVAILAENIAKWVKSGDENIGWGYIDYYENPVKTITIPAEVGGNFTIMLSDKAN